MSEDSKVSVLPVVRVERFDEAAGDYAELLKEVQQLRLFAGFIESVVSNPVGAYSTPALEGIFGLMRDKIAALPK